jgi:S-ribosylhomocysteine lyase
MPDLDHTTMVPPFILNTITRTTESGDNVFMWQLRVSQPNVAQLPTDVTHSLEHFMLHHLLSTTDKILLVAPMGCRTGFYVVALGIDDFEVLADLIAGALETVATATKVPGADDVHCGWAEHHSLVGAQRAAAWLLSRRDDWSNPGPNARELEEL